MLVVSGINLNSKVQGNIISNNQQSSPIKTHSQPIADTVSFGSMKGMVLIGEDWYPKAFLSFLKKFRNVIDGLHNVEVREYCSYFVADSSDPKMPFKIDNYMMQMDEARVNIVKKNAPKDIKGLAKKLLAHKDEYPYIVTEYNYQKMAFTPKSSKLTVAYTSGNRDHDDLRKNPELYEFLKSGGLAKEGIKVRYRGNKYLVRPVFFDNVLINLEAEKINKH